MSIIGLAIVAVIFTIYMIFQYKAPSSNYFLLYAMIYGAISHCIWALSIKNLQVKNIFLYGFIWDLVLTIILLTVPFIIADISLSKIQIIGISLMVLGSVLIKVS